MTDAERTVIDFSISDENQFIADLDDIYSSCQDMKRKTEEEKLNQTRTVIESMGSKGYIAVDVENQINMANAENAEMSDFMVLDVSVVSGGKVLEGMEFYGKFGKVKHLKYKVGYQGDIMY